MAKKGFPAVVAGTVFLLLAVLFCAGAADSQEQPLKLKVIAELANIRKNPDIGSPIIHQLPQGAIIQALKIQGEWYSIEFAPDGEKTLTGYVHESLVMPLIPPAPRQEKKKAPETETPNEAPVRKEPPEPAPSLSPDKTVSQDSFRRFGVSLWSGLNYAAVGDMNEGVDGLAGYYGATLGERTGKYPGPVHWSALFGAGFSYFLSPGTAVNLSLDYIAGKKRSIIEFPERQFTETLTVEPEVISIPVTLSLIYRPAGFIRLRLGVEVHLAQCRYFYQIEKEEIKQNWQGEASASGIGLAGGIGFERNILSPLSLFLEISGRYARIKNWEGKDVFTDSDGSRSTEEGDLYIYRGRVSQSESFPLVFIRKKRPSEAGVSDVRLASLNLSGISIRAGIMIKF